MSMPTVGVSPELEPFFDPTHRRDRLAPVSGTFSAQSMSLTKEDPRFVLAQGLLEFGLTLPAPGSPGRFLETFDADTGSAWEAEAQPGAIIVFSREMVSNATGNDWHATMGRANREGDEPAVSTSLRLPIEEDSPAAMRSLLDRGKVYHAAVRIGVVMEHNQLVTFNGAAIEKPERPKMALRQEVRTGRSAVRLSRKLAGAELQRAHLPLGKVHRVQHLCEGRDGPKRARVVRVNALAIATYVDLEAITHIHKARAAAAKLSTV